MEKALKKKRDALETAKVERERAASRVNKLRLEIVEAETTLATARAHIAASDPAAEVVCARHFEMLAQASDDLDNDESTLFRMLLTKVAGKMSKSQIAQGEAGITPTHITRPRDIPGS